MDFFPQGFPTVRSNKLRDITLRGFGGGLNAIDNDLSMDQKFQPSLTNFRRTPGGSQKLRFGTRWLTNVNNVVTGDIVDQVVFTNAIISVTSTGQIAATTFAGVNTAIWNSAVAAAMPAPAGMTAWANSTAYTVGQSRRDTVDGRQYNCAVNHTSAAGPTTFAQDRIANPTFWTSPAAWSATNSVDFVPFRNQLIVHNGVDKPLTISSLLAVTYLADAATGSNTNTPIGRYGCTVANFHCVAGIPAAPTTVYISSQGTSGTFPGDPAPNNSLSVDVGAYAPEDSAEIRGIAGFRSFLLIFFSGQCVVVQLGVFSGVTHTPQFPDTLPTFGLLGHRCLVQIENDLKFAGFGGVGSATRNLLSNLPESTYLSDYIEPLYRQRLGQLTDAQLLRNTFAVYDRLTHDLMVFTPNGIAFDYSFNDKLRYKSWSKFQTPNWTCGCSSPLGRVFFSIDSRIYQSGNTVFAGEAFYADRLEDRLANWASVTVYSPGQVIRDTVTNESYICIVGHTSGAVSFSQDRVDQAASPKWELYLGETIPFDMEMPWLTSKDPMKTKFNRFVSIGTKGDAEFTLKAFVDNLYKDVDGNIVYNPAISVDFIGNDAPGFGFDAGPYGGGRRSNDPRLYNFPIKFKTLKPVFSGSARKTLEITHLSFLYNVGKFRR
jgi:hypothetical protein